MPTSEIRMANRLMSLSLTSQNIWSRADGHREFDAAARRGQR
jgi:hypothetical protein